jgi:hypothetical protein
VCFAKLDHPGHTRYYKHLSAVHSGNAYHPGNATRIKGIHVNVYLKHQMLLNKLMHNDVMLNYLVVMAIVRCEHPHNV